MENVVVSLSGVKKVFSTGKTEVQALRGIDLEIRKGEFTALAGPSGSGKTTLLNLIGGLDFPSEGVVKVANQDLSQMSGRELSLMRLGHLGFIFQSYNLIPVLTAEENAEYVMVLQGVPASERRRRVLELFKDIGIDGLEDRRPNELSGGQQQRVTVARAIVSNPSLVLADEPTANLDSESGVALLELMKELNTKHGVTFLFSTHDPMITERARRLVSLRDGRVVSDEVRDQIAT